MKSLQITQNIVPYLIRDQRYHAFLASYLLKSAICVLQTGSQQTNHNLALVLIVDIYSVIRGSSNNHTGAGGEVLFSTFMGIEGIEMQQLQVQL